MDRAVVLLSAGLDSTVNLYAAHRELEIVQVLTFNYGQRAAQREIQQAKEISQGLGFSHRTIDLPFFKDLGQSSLLNTNFEVPVGMGVRIDDLGTSQKTAKSVWVSNRNGIFLNIAAGFAESLAAKFVIPGFNLEEAATFPDNSEEYLQQLNHCFSFSTANKVKVKCYTTSMSKTELVAFGEQLRVPWSKAWPCYFDGESWCGSCESCQRAKRALSENKIETKSLFGQNLSRD